MHHHSDKDQYLPTRSPCVQDWLWGAAEHHHLQVGPTGGNCWFILCSAGDFPRPSLSPSSASSSRFPLSLPTTRLWGGRTAFWTTRVALRPTYSPYPWPYCCLSTSPFSSSTSYIWSELNWRQEMSVCPLDTTSPMVATPQTLQTKWYLIKTKIPENDIQFYYHRLFMSRYSLLLEYYGSLNVFTNCYTKPFWITNIQRLKHSSQFWM